VLDEVAPHAAILDDCVEVLVSLGKGTMMTKKEFEFWLNQNNCDGQSDHSARVCQTNR